MTPIAHIVSGALLCRDFLESSDLQTATLDAATIRAAAVLSRCAGELGPAAPTRRLFDLFATRLASLLGFELRDAASPTPDCIAATCVTSPETGPVATLITVPWGARPERYRLTAITETLARKLRWCLLTNVHELRLIDAARPHSRRWIAFDLQASAGDTSWLARLIAVSGRHAFDADGARTRLEWAIARSDAHLRTVKATLQRGVEAAAVSLTRALVRSSRRDHDATAAFDEALTLIYRILFLLFAEARGLVPVWHPDVPRWIHD